MKINTNELNVRQEGREIQCVEHFWKQDKVWRELFWHLNQPAP